MKEMQWVPVPNKHDGEGFLTIMDHKDGLIIYGAWHLILQVASKCDPRGTLVRDDGTPHTAASISKKTRWKRISDIQTALDFCSSKEVGWIEIICTEPQAGAEIPQAGAEIPHEPARKEGRKEGMEGREGKEGTPLDFLSLWNESAKKYGLSEIREITETRKDKIRVRNFSEDRFRLVLAAIGESKFLRGENNKEWRVDFDWIFENENNALKILEGKYKDKPKTEVSSRPEKNFTGLGF